MARSDRLVWDLWTQCSQREVWLGPADYRAAPTP
jgi:uncharacterized protein YndB with AHSA1/START domain